MYARPHGSPADLEFRRRYLGPLPGVTEDRHKNVIVRQGQGDDANRVLWSCHTDTVHHHAGRQTIIRTGDTYRLANGSKSSCLGADDTVGVWLLVQLIRRGVPGTYVFHYGEESGGIGSSALAKSDPVWLERFPIAIALDRAGQHDIITHQSCFRTASDAFADSLAVALGQANPVLRYSPSPGVYTDTAEYADIIPECTNLSVGYLGQHSKDETADYAFACQLLEALTVLDVRALKVERDPTVADVEPFWSSWDDHTWRLKDDDHDLPLPRKHAYLTDEYAEVQDSLWLDRYSGYGDRYDQIQEEDRLERAWASLKDYRLTSLREAAARSYHTAPATRLKKRRPALFRGSRLLNWRTH